LLYGLQVLSPVFVVVADQTTILLHFHAVFGPAAFLGALAGAYFLAGPASLAGTYFLAAAPVLGPPLPAGVSTAFFFG